MKKIICIICIGFIFIFPSRVKAQMPSIVTDIGSYAYYADMIAQELANFEIISENLKITQETLKKIETVNSYLQTSELVLAIADNLDATYKELRKFPKTMEIVTSEVMKEKYLKEYNIFKRKLKVFSEMLSMTIKSKQLQGEDFQRLQFLERLYKSSEDLLRSIGGLNATIFYYSMKRGVF